MNPMCTWCASDEYVDTYDDVADEAWCRGPGHPEPRMFEPKKEAAARDARERTLSGLSYGIAYELGLYDDLVEVLESGVWMETGAVEFRYARAHPEVYWQMLDRWGHVAQSPRKYSVTSFIGSTLGQLSRWTGLPRVGVTSEMACPEGRPERMSRCPSPIPRSFVTTS